MIVFAILFSLMTSQLVFSSTQYLPKEAFTFDFNIRTVSNHYRHKENKIDSAIDVIREVIASPEFRSGILKHKFNGRKAFSHSVGLTNNQIYHKILAGAERLKPLRNNTMDMEISFFTNHESKTIGYTRPDTRRVWINTKYFNRFSKEEVAANLVHEWLHKLGFCHDATKTKSRKYSVPYAVGNMVKKIGRRLIR